MGEINYFTKEKLMSGLLFSNPDQAATAKIMLIEHFGQMDFVSDLFHFSSHSHYYDQEMHGEVWRQFFSFKELVDPANLAKIKLLTNHLESQFQQPNYRPINIDPGLINTGRLVLATTKQAAHRIALSQGIYGELTLFYSQKQWQTLPWTYPDFRTDETQSALSHIRKLYRGALRAH